MAAAGGVETDALKTIGPPGFGFHQAQGGQFVEQAIDAPGDKRVIEFVRGDPLPTALDGWYRLWGWIRSIRVTAAGSRAEAGNAGE